MCFTFLKFIAFLGLIIKFFIEASNSVWEAFWRTSEIITKVFMVEKMALRVVLHDIGFKFGKFDSR
jgi:hypothetical protein